MKKIGNLSPLGIGSMPFTDISYCLEQIINTYENFPYWPQLPNLNNYENMYIQYSEGLPNCHLDINKASIYVNISTLTNEQIEKFYNAVINNDIDFFKISEKFSKGIYALKNFLPNLPPYLYLKGHVTGPVSFGLTLTDENKKSLIYNDELRDIITNLISFKGKWQEKFFNQKMIIFFDEPYMVSYGSAFFNLPEQIIIEMFNQCFNNIDGIPGIHCCGNTDWSLILKTDVKIINFDAFEYMDNFLLYSKEIKDFLENGGFLAWGLIPTNEKIRETNIEILEKIFDKAIKELTSQNCSLETILSQSFITPSCGTGSMNHDDAIKVFKLNKQFSDYLKEKYHKYL